MGLGSMLMLTQAEHHKKPKSLMAALEHSSTPDTESPHRQQQLYSVVPQQGRGSRDGGGDQL